jgi:predicted HNH restriction endonuclease
MAEACLEVHHSRVAVADMEQGHETALEDTQLLCANCHRLVHREMKV